MVVRYVPLDAPDVIENIDLRPYMYAECESQSNGTINDFTPHSPVVALYEGVDFSNREIRSQINKTAFLAAIAHLKIAGVQRRLGSQAKVTLAFTLTSPLSNNFTLSAGYIVSTDDNLQFSTDTLLVIPPGSITGFVTATSLLEGIKYNVASQTITNLTESRAYLKGVTNLDPATGGNDEETIDEVLSRGFAALRYRGVLISADDFEQEVIRILGVGTVAKAIGLLSSDKITIEKGVVHVFVLNPDGTIPNDAECADIQSQLQAQIPTFLQDQKTISISSAVYVSGIDIELIDINVIAALIPGDNPETRANQIRADLNQYLAPGNLELGKTLILKEIENVVRQTGVAYIQSVSFQVGSEVSYSDYILDNSWSAAKLNSTKVTLVDSFGQEFIYQY